MPSPEYHALWPEPLTGCTQPLPTACSWQECCLADALPRSSGMHSCSTGACSEHDHATAFLQCVVCTPTHRCAEGLFQTLILVDWIP